MAYSDYVQIYNVSTEAGITSNDAAAAQVAKIAAWINTKFADIVTAEVINDTDVRILDKTVNAGFGWGASGSKLAHRLKYIGSGLGTYTEIIENYVDMTISNLGFFVCKTNNVLVMDFINMAGTDNFSTRPSYIRFAADNGTKSACVFCIANSSPKEIQWRSISGNMTAPPENSTASGYMMCGGNNVFLSKTMLTKFAPYGTNLIADDIFVLKGSVPQNKTVFEVNGSKYLCLSYQLNTNNYSYEYGHFAVKLS